MKANPKSPSSPSPLTLCLLSGLAALGLMACGAEALPGDPCADNSTCADELRTCLVSDGQAICGDCLESAWEIDGVCTARSPSCTPDPCNGHGTCDDAEGYAVCACEPGYEAYVCAGCAEGFRPWPEGADNCVDDLCDPDPCQLANAIPENACVQLSASSRACLCQDGHGWDGTACVPGLSSLPDGAFCQIDDQCQGGHCQNHHCCTSGDCCAQADDCPASYREDAVCDDAATCQGHRAPATCTGFVCAAGPTVDDDSACSRQTLSKSCAPFASVFCSGAAEQQTMACAVTCSEDRHCQSGFHCDEGACLEDSADGGACDEASDCQSGYCDHGACCEAGECCPTPGTVEQEPCARCGHLERTCTERFLWTEWTGCLGQGLCEPSTTAPCGLCGTKTCEANCQYGACNPGVVDSYEENDERTAAARHAEIKDCDGEGYSLDANINPASDADWYVVHIKDDWCSLDPKVKLSGVPAGQTYELCTYYVCDSEAKEITECQEIQGSEDIDPAVDCSGVNDSGDLFVRIRPVTAGSCDNYKLEIRG